MITRAASVAIPVSDQDEAIGFFVGVLGFEKRVDVEIGGRRWVEVAPPGADTVLTPYTWVEHHGDRVGGFSRVVLECDDVRKTCDELRERGVPCEWADGGGYAVVTDPSGNEFVLAPR
ncbi:MULTISPECIES: VOC family protein [Actinosynnema]|uniref:Glyoxalase n=1 Tax=Actinosynnema pretiosum TaxID=42197 RepID=A0A290Z688_9PSEU|nr:VOC family protein [Actinosynnema pretiosum]ATE54492.1 glyoxalase [Actinosynnema pretiosum]